MLIGEFALRTGLSQDTVRFYIRKGLLVPRLGQQGGRNPYQHFSERDVSIARMIRFAQSLGLSLREIAAVAGELQQDGITPERELDLLDAQVLRLEEKAAELARLTGYLRRKRDWIARGRPGDEPQFAAESDCLAALGSPGSGQR